MSVYDNYTEEEWNTLLCRVLPTAQMSGVLNQQANGITVHVKLTASVSKESYKKAEDKYFRLLGENPERYSKKYLIEKKSDFIVTSGPFDVGEALAFVLNLPFDALPFYVNTHVKYIKKLVQARLELGK